LCAGIYGHTAQYFEDVLNPENAKNDDRLELICFAEVEAFTTNEVTTHNGDRSVKIRKSS